MHKRLNLFYYYIIIFNLTVTWKCTTRECFSLHSCYWHMSRHCGLDLTKHCDSWWRQMEKIRVTGPLFGEFTGRRWIPLTKASDAQLWWFFFICAWINGWVNNREAGDLRRHRAHYDVTVMTFCLLYDVPVFFVFLHIDGWRGICPSINWVAG